MKTHAPHDPAEQASVRPLERKNIHDQNQKKMILANSKAVIGLFLALEKSID